MLDNLKDSFFWSAILDFATLIGIPSFFLAIYSLIKGKRKKEFSVSKDGYWIVKKGKKKIEKMNILFDGKEIDDLTITKFVIWNSGNEEIRREDIVSVKPLLIKNIGKSIILDASIVVESDPTNLFAIKEIEPEKVIFDFENANKSDGIVVQILHTGSSDDLICDCKIKGGEEIREHKTGNVILQYIFSNNSIHTLIDDFMIGFAVFSCVFLVRAILAELRILPFSNTQMNKDTGQSFLLLIIYFIELIIIVALYYHKIRSIFKIGVPTKLKKYIR